MLHLLVRPPVVHVQQQRHLYPRTSLSSAALHHRLREKTRTSAVFQAQKSRWRWRKWMRTTCRQSRSFSAVTSILLQECGETKMEREMKRFRGFIRHVRGSSSRTTCCSPWSPEEMICYFDYILNFILKIQSPSGHQV